MSNTWTEEEVRRIGDATELQVATERPDGTLRPYVTIWGVRSGDSIYIRSAHGPENGWFRHAAASGAGRIRAGGTERDVYFAQLDSSDPAQGHIDAAYHAKYDSYGPRIVGSVVGPAATIVTLRVSPR